MLSDKLAVDRRKYSQLSLTDDGPLYRTKRPPLPSLVHNTF